MKILRFFPALWLVALPAHGQSAREKAVENIVYPDDSGVTNVVKDYGADPTGKTDATQAIQKALTEKKALIYFPNGTYLISDRLDWGERQTRQIFQGQSESGVTLKLADNCPGYGSVAQPKAIIWTGKAPAQRFRNGLRNLTINTGKGNPGAIGAQYIANNQGAIHDVTIVSGDGSGPIGLDLGYSNEQGPCLIEGVTVRGFDIGIFMKHAVDGVVLENIRVENQNVAGVVNDGQSVSMRNFASRNAVPAFQNKRGASLLALDVADLQGTGAALQGAAIENGAGLFARNMATSGYKWAIDNAAGKVAQVAGPKIAEFVSHPILSLFPSPPRSLNLPVKETPVVPHDDLKDWINVQNFKPKPAEFKRPDGKKIMFDDWTDAIQQAIDSGKSTVYFPSGKYVIAGTVRVRGNVRRLIGLEAGSWTKPGGLPSGTIIFEDGAAPVVLFERFDIMYAELQFKQASKRTVVISSTICNEHAVFEKLPNTGDVFFEDVSLGQYIQNGGQTWARQLNLEGHVIKPKAVNDGGTLWILGLKTEDDAILIDAKNGAKSEIVGGFIYGNKNRDPEKVMFHSVDSSISFTVGEWVIRDQPFNPIRETRNGQTRTLRKGQAPARGQGSMVPLFVGHSGNATAPPAAPEKLSATAPTTSRLDVKWTPAPGADGYLVETSGDGKTFVTIDTVAPETEGYSITSGLKAATPYFVRLTAFNGKGQAASAPVTASTLPPAPVGKGGGLRGDYYAGRAFETHKGTRTDAQVNFDWKIGAPFEGVQPTNFSARWTGQIEPRCSETYSFSTERDKTRVWIDGKLVVDGWSSRSWNGSLPLVAGRKYDLKIEMWSESPGAAATLFWQSFNQPKELVPASQLYPATAAMPEIEIVASTNEIAENDAKPVQFTVSRSGETKSALTLDFVVAGSATAGADFKQLPGTLALSAGSERATLTLEILNDKQAESDEAISISLAPSAFYNLRGGTQNLAIKDDDLPPAGKGTGLKGEYFDDRDFKVSKGTRADVEVNFGWNLAAPFPGIAPKKGGRDSDGYSVRWTGQIQPLFSEKYLFELNFGSYAGARLWIGDTMVVDAWEKGKLRSGFIELKAGQKYPIRIEMSQRNFYDGRMQLKWTSPSQFEQSVPKSQLFPAP